MSAKDGIVGTGKCSRCGKTVACTTEAWASHRDYCRPAWSFKSAKARAEADFLFGGRLHRIAHDDRAELVDLVERMRKYAQHTDSCNVYPDFTHDEPTPGGACDCGFGEFVRETWGAA